MENKKKYKINLKLWKGIAIVSAVFAFFICVLLIANYAQIKRIDPVNTEAINLLVDRLKQNPQDTALRNEIRELDLLVRKAYFTNQWQVRTGGYILLISIVVLIIAVQILLANKKPEPEPTEGEGSENLILVQKKARKWIAIIGGGIVIIALFVAFLTHNEMEEKFHTIAYGTTAVEETPATAQESQQAVPLAETTEPEETPQQTEENIESDMAEQAAPKQDIVEEETPVAKPPSADAIYANHPAFRGPGGNGVVYHKNIPVDWDGAGGKNIIWKLPIPLPGYNSPVIWGDKIFLSGADENKRELYCIDRNSGKILWTGNADNIPNSPTEKLDVPAYTGLAAPTVTTNGKGVFAIFANGDIIGYDMNGERLWARNLGMPKNHYGHSSSLIMHKDKLIVQYDMSGSANIMALSSKTGETIWKTQRDARVSWASPIIVNTGTRDEIIVVADPLVASYDPQNGVELWKLNCMAGEVGPSAAYANGMVFALNEYASLVGIKLGEQPAVVWEDYDYLSDIPSPVANDKYLFVSTSYGTMACFDAQNGTKYWEHEFDNSIYASPILAEGKIYLLDRQGIMHICKAADTYQPIAEPALGEKSDCTPAFAEGRIYIRGEKNLYSIGK